VDAAELRVHLHGSRDSQPGWSEALVDGIRDPRVVFHGAFAPGELGSVLAGLDVLVVPSLWYENTPFSVLEAMYAGVPVIASDRGGIAEVVQDGISGWLFPAGSAARLGAMLAALCADPAPLAKLSLPRPPMLQHNVAELRALYEALVGESTPAA
jgi:glycosyltransferase involved in cell wall biosynthesis